MWSLPYIFSGVPRFAHNFGLSEGGLEFFDRNSGTRLIADLDFLKALSDRWPGKLFVKGITDVEDAYNAIKCGCTGIYVSNHGGRQLDGSRSPFDQLAEIVDAVGDKIDVIMDSGVQRGTHVLKALSLGAKAVGGGRFYLYALAAAGQAGVERALTLMKQEIERDMRLMGVKSIAELSRKNLRYR